MSDCSKNKNPLVRNGTSRSQRSNAALGENFVVPDENKFEQWLVYARDLGKYIKYYSLENKKTDEDWQAFFDADVSAQLALIAVQDVNDFKERIRSLLDRILSTDLQGDLPELRKTFGLLFSGAITLAYRLDYFAKLLPENITLKRTINNLAMTRLGSALKRLLGYYKAAEEFYTPSLVEDKVVDEWTILAFGQEKLSTLIDKIKKELSTKWLFNPVAATTFEDYYNSEIPQDKTVYNFIGANIPASQVWQVVNHAANHNLFTSLFAEFLSSYAKVVGDAKAQLLATITQQNTHDPYYALYLTFLHLFKSAQKDLNSFSGRHFDFYYKDVLRLKPKKSEPNHAHLIIELANNVGDHMISKGVEFKGGKDSLGKEVVYSNDKDVVLNRSQVTELRSFYKATALDKIGIQSQEGLIFASPVAASSDGMGAKLTTESKDWHPFANKIFVDGKLNQINMPVGLIGFGIASHYLFLKEGERSIVLNLKGQNLNRLNNKNFIVYYTAEKKWQETNYAISGTSTSQATITISIASGDAPVTAFNQKIHLDAYADVNTPVVKFLLNNVAGKNQYDDLKDVMLSDVKLTVRCGQLGSYNTQGLKELLISTDQGIVDPSKPFLPFGQKPKAGAGLVIGSKEVFSKENAKVTLSISWAELLPSIKDMDKDVTSIFFPTAQYKFLENGVWADGQFSSILNSEHSGTPKPGEVEIFWGADFVMMSEIYVPSTAVNIPQPAIVDYQDEYEAYGIASQNGFMKLQLNQDFQFDAYFLELQLYLIGVANKTIDPNTVAAPIEPYTPKIHSIYLSYEASIELKFNEAATSSKFFHYYPFGFDQLDSSDVTGGKVFLFPQFTHKKGFVPIHNIGEFYLGIKDVITPQKVEILFKVLEGSTDPLKSKPDEHVHWSYLSKNHWIDFDKNEINDGTRQLIETGIISFPFPDKATKDNTILPAGLHWLRASIKEMPDQVCRIIDVKAQAIQVTFLDRQNAEDFLKLPLPAGSISKLKEPDAAVKKVEQPYSSFGGRFKEDRESFNIRISERLRHKNRAITIRDYEQLVLEGFPDIHKVKCLNHTRLELKETSTIYNEQAAGYVTVITIPDLRKKNAINPLRPYTSRNKLQEIRDYLLARGNCNATIYVENPAFEEIRIVTTIILTDKSVGNEGFFKNKLKQDILAFLTPWAYDLNTDINFGGRVTKSEIINFIEERDYVDFILDLKMFHNKMDGGPEVSVVDQVMASTARSVLVSAPASTHDVTIVPKPPKPVIDGCD